MNVSGTLDINGIELTNKEVTVTYTPSSSIKSYTYEVFKDGTTYLKETVSQFRSSKSGLDKSGKYDIVGTTIDKKNNSEVLESGFYNLDLDAPTTTCNKSSFNVYLNSDASLLKDEILNCIKANDKQDGNLENNVVINMDDLNTSNLGMNLITYSVTDSAGNTTSKSLPIYVVEDNRMTLLGFRFGLALIAIFMIFWFIRYKRSVRLEKRFSKYSVEAVYDRRVSFVDSIMKLYSSIINKTSTVLKKSVVIKKYSKKYDKYISLYKGIYNDSISFIAVKIFSSIIFLLFAILSKTLQSDILHLYECLLPLLIGFFVPDIVYISKYKLHKNRLENDLLQAIIIMNNAFKSGRSIEQAIELVTKELDGPIAEEFKKMHLELSFGLSVDVVFGRFAKRVELEEVSYLTASLSILNKTGGNIIKVFTSIEKTLFNKKKLRLELASLTGGSKLVVYMLIFIPILFVVSISLINPTYFEGFYTTTVGFILMSIIIVIYIAYIFCVRKIMKVRM